jgi:hypothetical protein
VGLGGGRGGKEGRGGGAWDKGRSSSRREAEGSLSAEDIERVSESAGGGIGGMAGVAVAAMAREEEAAGVAVGGMVGVTGVSAVGVGVARERLDWCW